MCVSYYINQMMYFSVLSKKKENSGGLIKGKMETIEIHNKDT